MIVTATSRPILALFLKRGVPGSCVLFIPGCPRRGLPSEQEVRAQVGVHGTAEECMVAGAARNLYRTVVAGVGFRKIHQAFPETPKSSRVKFKLVPGGSIKKLPDIVDVTLEAQQLGSKIERIGFGT